MSENLCAEFGRDIVLDFSKRVAAASGREKLSGNLCVDSGRGRDNDLNTNKRDEADSGFEHFSGDPCVVFFFGRNIGGGLQVSKQVDLCSLSSLGLALCVDSRMRVDAGMTMRSFCITENSWTVLDPTVNVVFRVDDLKLLSAAHSRNADTMAHSTLCACKSADGPRKRRVEIWTENVSIGQEPDSDDSVGSGAFCIEYEECSMYILPL